MNTANEVGQYAFFLDIDGTLMNQGVICRKNRTAIRQARQAGHLVFINTARSYGIIPEKILKIKTDGIISSLGSSFVIGGEHRVCGGFTPVEAWEAMEYLTRMGCRVLYETEKTTFQNLLWGEPNEKTVTSLAQTEAILAGDNVAKAYVAGTVPAEAAAHLSKKYLFFQHPDYAEYSTG